MGRQLAFQNIRKDFPEFEKRFLGIEDVQKLVAYREDMVERLQFFLDCAPRKAKEVIGGKLNKERFETTMKEVSASLAHQELLLVEGLRPELNLLAVHEERIRDAAFLEKRLWWFRCTSININTGQPYLHPVKPEVESCRNSENSLDEARWKSFRAALFDL